MSRKTILIIVAIILIALGVWVYITYKNPSGNQGGPSQNTLGSLFPFGTSGNTPTKPATGSGTTGTGTSSSPHVKDLATERLVQVTSKYIAGFTVLPPSTAAPIPTVDINDPTGAQTIPVVYPKLRFVERGTGYIYDIDAKGQNLSETSGTVIAHTLVALFGDQGNTVIFRYIKDDNITIATYLGHLVPAAGSSSFGTTAGSFLADNISDMVMSHDGKNILYLLPTASGADGMTVKTNGTSPKEVFSSSFSEWLLDWPSTGPVVTTKASADIPGYAYAVTGSGVLNKLLGNVSGLTTKMSPDGKNILYSVSFSGHVDLHIKNIASGADLDTGLSTLPEKCVWNATSTLVYCGAGTSVSADQYPDVWYQGSAHFNDALWKIDAATGTTTEMDDGEGNFLDATYLTLDSKEQFLFFINKNDASLWSFDLTAPATTPQTPTLPNVK